MEHHSTLILGARDVEALLTFDECIAAVEAAFRLHAEGHTLPPATLVVPSGFGGFHVKAAGLQIADRVYFAAKTNANFPGNPERTGLPTIQGVIVLCDGANGVPLAVMDSIVVTSRRTAAATAVAAKYLAQPVARTAMIYGCGEQGSEQLRALTRVLPLARAYVFDANRSRATSFARKYSAELNLEIVAVDDPVPSLGASQVCVTCTTANEPIIWRDEVQPGTFIAAVGADNPQKQELDPRILASSTVVVDLLDSCAANGELRHALAAGLMTREDVHADLAELVTGRKAGRRRSDETTVFDSTGTALEDVAAAVVVYTRALAMGRGVAVDLGARA